jgi:hypothetical protein
VPDAVEAALASEDFYRLIFELPKRRFLYMPSFAGMHYIDILIVLDFARRRSNEPRLARLKGR